MIMLNILNEMILVLYVLKMVNKILLIQHVHILYVKHAL